MHAVVWIAIVLKLKNIKCWSYFIVGHLESVTVEGGDYEIGVLVAAGLFGTGCRNDIYLLLNKRVVRKFTFCFKNCSWR